MMNSFVLKLHGLFVSVAQNSPDGICLTPSRSLALEFDRDYINNIYVFLFDKGFEIIAA